MNNTKKLNEDENKGLNKLFEDMHNNVESLIGAYGIDKVCAVSTSKQFSWAKFDKSDKQFDGIAIYPAELNDVINYINTIVEEDDCDTVQSIIDLFNFTITTRMMIVRQNRDIFNEVKAMLKSYDASIIRFIYASKHLTDDLKLTFDYDEEVYILCSSKLNINIKADENFMIIR